MAPPTLENTTHAWSIALNPEALAQRVADVASERKALDLVVLDVRGKSSYADFLVICSGTSDRHVQSIAEFVSDSLRKEDAIKTLGSEGIREGQWALVDLGDVVLHVFHQFTRDVYALEELWAEAPRLELSLQAAGS